MVEPLDLVVTEDAQIRREATSLGAVPASLRKHALLSLEHGDEPTLGLNCVHLGVHDTLVAEVLRVDVVDLCETGLVGECWVEDVVKVHWQQLLEPGPSRGSQSIDSLIRSGPCIGR